MNNHYLLEKFAGKGGWVYAAIPEIVQNKENPFGWVRVKGSIDGFAFKAVHLMPMGNGKLFLPVKAEIRKKISKKEGDQVHVILSADEDPVEIPAELENCLRDEPALHKTFLGYSGAEQKAFIDWIYAAKKETTRIERIADMLNKLAKKQKLN